MVLPESLVSQLRLLPGHLGAHLALTTLALLIGVSVSLPLGVFAARSRRWGRAVVLAAAVVQTIPGLAMLALMVPLLGAFGFYPALAALVLYSLLPVLRNTVTGLVQVDAAVLEAARAMGMTPRQVLRQVELPLALPVIVAGVRTAAVWCVGIATLSTPVGQNSLGNFIFSGLQTRNWTSVLVGCVAAAVLALMLDALLAAVEFGVAKRRYVMVWGAGAALGLLLVGGSSTLLLRPNTFDAAPGERGGTDVALVQDPGTSANDRAPLRVGSKTFTEQYILARLIERRLSFAGLRTERVESLGSTIAFDALRTGQIDVYVDYTGTIYANYMGRDDVAPDWQVTAATSAWLASAHGVRQLGRLGFENAYVLATTRETSERLGVHDIADLSAVAGTLRLGSDYEFLQRPEWPRLRDTYGLSFSALLSFDSSFMYSALSRGNVDVITAFSSDGRIQADALVVLDDPKQAFPPYDAVLLLAPQVADDRTVVEALQPLLGSISVSTMRAANWMVDRDADKRSIDAAASWLDGSL